MGEISPCMFCINQRSKCETCDNGGNFIGGEVFDFVVHCKALMVNKDNKIKELEEKIQTVTKILEMIKQKDSATDRQTNITILGYCGRLADATIKELEQKHETND